MSFTVNQALANSAAAATVSVSITIPAGNSVGCWVACNGAATFTLTDSGSNTYTNNSIGSASNLTAGTGYFLALSSGITSVTATATGATNIYLTVWDVSATGTISVPGSNSQVYSFNTTTTTDGISTNSITVTGTDALLLAGCAEFSSAALTHGTGFTLDTTLHFNAEITEHLAVSASQAATFTDSGTGNFAVAAGFAMQAASGSGVTKSLTGQTATFTEGTPTAASAYAVSGRTATFTEGTATRAVSYAATGRTATFTEGTVARAVTYAPSGQTATFTEGTITASTGGNVTLSLSGQTATFSEGTISGSLTYAATGQSATFTEGAPTPSVAYGPAGQTATFTEGSISVTQGGNVTLTLSGQTSTFTEGQVAGAVSSLLTGQTGTFSEGALSGALTYSVASQSATFTEGAITPATSGNVTIALTGQTASFSEGQIAAFGGVALNVGAGRPRRTIYFVTIDGQQFECRSVKEALALLAKAKETARKLAEDKAMWAVNLQGQTSQPVPIPKIEAPKITASSRELRSAVAQTKREIVEIYAKELQVAEIRMYLELAKRQADDDESLILLM